MSVLVELETILETGGAHYPAVRLHNLPRVGELILFEDFYYRVTEITHPASTFPEMIPDHPTVIAERLMHVRQGRP
jgi:hypothetical protein